MANNTPPFSALVARLEASKISQITDLVAQRRQRGDRLYDLSMGQPDAATPDYICAAARAAMAQGETGYTPVTGTHRLKEAIIEKYRRDNGLQFQPPNIAVGSGAKPLLTDTLRALVGPGDEVIVATPCWTCHPGMIRLVGATPVLIPTRAETGFKMTPETLTAAITKRTRALIINAPANPTGAVYNRAELSALATVLERHPSIWIVTDDLYEYIVFDGNKCHSILEIAPELGHRTVLINGVSKAYAMTGWRVGYAAGPEPVMKNLNKLMSQGVGCPSSISQAAACAALNGPMDFVHQTVATYEQRRNRLVPALNAIPGLTCRNPEGAFYLYPGLADLLGSQTPTGKRIATSTDFVAYLLEQWSVATVPGIAFEHDPHLRISIAAATEELTAAVNQIEQAVAALSP